MTTYTTGAGELIIGDHTPAESPCLSAGMRGLVPRDLQEQRVGYSAAIPPAQMQVYSLDEIARIADERERTQSRLSDIIQTADGGKYVPSLDQNGQGYCWAYAAVGALMMARAKMRLPFARLSAHAVACKVKNFRDEGGWGALALDYIIKHGCPDVDHWPEKSMSRSHDTAETWANAALYKPDAVFADLSSPVYNRDLSFAQQMTCVVDLNPLAEDHDFWGHAISSCDAVNGKSQRVMTRADSGKLVDLPTFDAVWGMNSFTAGLGKRIRNSWTDRYGNRGFAVLTGSKANASNAVAIITATA
jgi:hypothetical protein